MTIQAFNHEPFKGGKLTTQLGTTDAFQPGKFRPHGRVEFEEQGALLISRAIGPFNTELMEALAGLAMGTFPAMAAKGIWVNICTFFESALCAPDVLQTFAKTVQQLHEANITPAAVAFVMAPEVEGAHFMQPLYAKCFEQAGVPFEAFSDWDGAYQWVMSHLAVSQSSPCSARQRRVISRCRP